MKVTNLINIPFLILSIILATTGFIFLGIGPVDSVESWKIAPVLIVVAYVILFPLSIILKK